MAKAHAPTAALEAASLGMELLGPAGARGDHLIETLYRDVKAMDIVEGTGQIQRIVMARQLVGLPRVGDLLCGRHRLEDDADVVGVGHGKTR